MKPLFRTLFAKISVVFLILIMFLSLVQMYLSLTCTFDYFSETSQKLHYRSAANLARLLQPELSGRLNSAKIEKIIQHASLLNPTVHIYLLDSSGYVLMGYNIEQPIVRKKVELRPIRKFLNSTEDDLPMLLANDPISNDGQTIFSVAPLKIAGTPGFLFLTFEGGGKPFSFKDILNSFIIRNTAMTAMLTVLLSLIVGIMLFSILTRRLHIMRNIVRRFEKGKYDVRIPVNANDEVDELAEAFNNMADTFEKYVQDLEQNDRLRRELIANISHDLRSPLASIRGYVETILMKEDQLKSEERRNFLEIILKNTIHLNELVSDLLDLAKFDAKQIKPELEPFSLSELVQDIILKFQPQAEAKQVQLLSRFPRRLPLVKGDIAMIDRVISNLIQNALKFVQPGGKVDVELKVHGKEVVVKIRDNGPGIPEQDLPHIFERFYRVEKSRTRHAAGSGLGLAIVKKIVEAHQAQIFVNSRLGWGTEFVFNLPVWERKPQLQVQ